MERERERPFRVIVVDPFPLVREGIVSLLKPEADLTIVAEAGDDDVALRLCREHRPDLLILSTARSNRETASLIDRLKQNAAATQIVVLAASCDQAVDVIAAGADGYLLKQEKRTALLEAIRAVARGEKRHSAAVVDALVQATPTEPPQLTARQLEVLRLAADGQTDAQIACTLGLSPSTVRYHLQNVYRRLNVKARVEAVAEAIRLGHL